MHRLGIKGKYHLEHIRDGKVIGTYELDNAVVDEGLTKILDVMFHAATQITSWFIGLINASGFTALANADTMATHTGWTEFTTYTEGVRQLWPADAAGSRAITNTTIAAFTISGSGTLKGLFLASNNTKGGTTGVLWATATFSGDVPVNNGDVARITYTISG